MIFTLWAEAHGCDWGPTHPTVATPPSPTRTEHTPSLTTNTLQGNRRSLAILNRCKTKVSIFTSDYLTNACQCWKVFLQVWPVFLLYIWCWWCHSSCLSASFPLQRLSFYQTLGVWGKRVITYLWDLPLMQKFYKKSRKYGRPGSFTDSNQESTS